MIVARKALCLCVIAAMAAHCSVYDADWIPKAGSDGAGGDRIDSGPSGGTGALDAGRGGSGLADATGSGGSKAGNGGASGAAGGAGGSGARGGGGGAAGSGGGGSSGAAGSAGGAAGKSGGAGNAGATGAAGAAGTGGTGATGGNSGTSGAAGNGGAGNAGAGGTGGAAGSIDAGPDTSPPTTALFSVGSFVKSGTTGAQVVPHALNQFPKALLLWSTSKTNETASSGFVYGFGVSDTNTSMAIGVGARDGVGTSSSSRRIAAKAITLVQAGEITIAEADFANGNTSSFTLNWSTNDTQPYVIHYLIIGGAQTTAKVVGWTFPPGTGNRAVTGVGFQPELVFHFNVGAAFTNAAPFSLGNAVFGIGAMDSAGGQWASMISDTSAVSPTVTSRAQMTDAALYAFTDAPAQATTKKASFVSMDPGGFTLNFTTANANAGQVVSLALGGIRARVGSFDKSTASAPASQPVAAGFQPGAVLITSFQSVAQTASIAEAQLRFGIGAADGTNEASSALVSTDAIATSNVGAVDKISKVFTKMDGPSLVTNAEADLASFDSTGFTLNWTKNDAAAASICFVALGAP